MVDPGAEPHGLDDAQARERLARHGPNRLDPQRGPGAIAQAWSQLATEPMFLLLLAAAALYLALGDRAEGLLLGGFAVLTVALALLQHQRSRKALDALRALSAPQARVLRGGAPRRVPAAEVVPGDLLLLEEGERVAADARVIRGSALSADESLLSGEIVPVAKPAGALVFAGTLVVGGHGAAEVQATGGDTEAGRIGALMLQQQPLRTRLQRDTARLVRVLGMLGAAASVGVVAVSVARGASWLEAGLSAVALAMALLPEEFALAMVVFFALGALRLARQQVLVRRASAIESLGTATVLAVDKTGTLTCNRMRVRAACAADEPAELWWDVGDATPAGLSIEALLRAAALASREHSADPLDRALLALPTGRRPEGARLLHEEPLAEGRPMVSAIWQSADGRVAACKGAAEAVLGRCTLDDAGRHAWAQRAGVLAERGWRVLGVAAARGADEAPFTWLGLIAFEDPLRDSVPEAVRRAHEAGIAVCLLTGDAPQTALAIARQAGIVGDGAKALLGTDIDAMDDDALAQATRGHAVFARVTPAHKLRLVRALQSGGEIVAMTGDGVNDAPALRAADIGIAMGAHGTDVAREAATLVLLDDDFGHLVEAVSQGRRLFDNLRKAMLYIVAIHVPIAGLALLPLLAGLPPVLLPAHVALTEMVIDPMCTLGYESLPAEREHMRRPPRPPGERLVGRRLLLLGAAQGALLLAAALAVDAWALAQGLGADGARFLGFATLTSGNLALALVDASRQSAVHARIARPFAWIALAALAALAVCVGVPGLRALFGFAWPGALPTAAALAAGVASALPWEVSKRWLQAERRGTRRRD